MSVKELEARVQALPPRQLEQFADWFDSFRNPAAPELTPGQETELLQRRADFLSNPSLAEPWEGTLERVRQHLHERRVKKTSVR